MTRLTSDIIRNRFPELLDVMYDMEDIQWTTEQWLIDLPKKWVWSFVYTEGGKIVGYCVASQKKEMCHVHRLMVHPWWRGRGIGTKMLDHLSSICQCGITLKTTTYEALDFYYKQGFLLYRGVI